MGISVPPLADKVLSQKVDFNKIYVYAISTVVALGGILFGFDMVIISGTVPFFTEYFQLSEASTGWAVGCINLGAAAGALWRENLAPVPS